MKVSVEEPNSYQRVLTIEVPPETVNAEIENIYEKVKKTASHPGFRKGKVPRKILEKKFSESIRMEAVEAAANTSIKDAFEEQKIVPLTEPEVGDLKFEGEGPLSFKVTVEVEPTIELGEYKGIELKRPKVSVLDEDIEKTIERLRVSQAKYIPAERAVEDGDFLVMDFEAFEGGKPVDGGKGENFPLEVGSGGFGEKFEGQLIGMNADEKKRVTVQYPEDYRAEEFAGKKIEFNVTVKDIKLRQLPELDDDFAKDLGEYDTLDKLKEHVRESLEKDLEKRIEHLMREQAVAKITADAKVEIPPKLKSKVAASIFEEEMTQRAYGGANEETLAQEKDKIAEAAETGAESQLKVKFVTDEICSQENLHVSDEELNENLDKIIEESEQKDPRVREYFKTERARERYRDQLRIKKVLDFIVDGAKIEEVDASQPDTEPEQPAEEEKGES